MRLNSASSCVAIQPSASSLRATAQLLCCKLAHAHQLHLRTAQAKELMVCYHRLGTHLPMPLSGPTFQELCLRATLLSHAPASYIHCNFNALLQSLDCLLVTLKRH